MQATHSYADPGSLRWEASDETLDSPAGRDAPLPKHRLGFALFLATTVVLLLRPADILPSLADWPIYNVLIVLAMLASLAPLLAQLSVPRMIEQPPVAAIFVMLAAVVLSLLVHGDIWNARIGGLEFLKIAVYFALLTALVNSIARLEAFMGVVCIVSVIMAVISLLVYHGVLDIESISTCSQGLGLDANGEWQTMERLQGPGIFHDPNDFSLLICSALLLSAHFASVARLAIGRLAWGATALPLGYAFHLTHSRGGFLALLAGLGVLALFRWGARKTIPAALILTPALFLMFAGRQTDINLGDANDTAQSRIQIWRDAIVMFHHQPLFGIGYGKLIDEEGMVAHNSYVQAFVELGCFGAAGFVGLIYAPASTLWKLRKQPVARYTTIGVWRPTVCAILAGTLVGLYSLTRIYSVSIYVQLGAVCSYTALAGADRPEAAQILNLRLLQKIALATVGTLLVLEVFIRVFAM